MPRLLTRAILAVALALPAAPAAAQLRLPDCPALLAFLPQVQLGERAKINPTGPLSLSTAFDHPGFAALYGKPARALAAEEIAQAAEAAEACAKEAGRERDTAREFTAMANELTRGLAPTLAALARAETQLATALDAIEAVPAASARLRALAALAAYAADRDERAATRLVARLGAPASQPGRAALDALRTLPEAAIPDTLAPRLARLLPAAREATLAEQRDRLAALPATAPGLRDLDRQRETTRAELGPALGEAGLAALEQATDARRAAITAGLLATAKARLDAMPRGFSTLVLLTRNGTRPLADGLDDQARAELDRHAATIRAAMAETATAEGIAALADIPDTKEGLATLDQLRTRFRANAAPVVGPRHAAAFDAATVARARTMAPALLPPFRAALAALPPTQEGLQTLDATVAETADPLLRFDAALAAPFTGEAATRRTALQAAFEREEKRLAALPLRGQTFADRDGTMKVEFRDRRRAYVTMPTGDVVEAAWEQDKDRIILRIPTTNLVLQRQGAALVGGPLHLRPIPKGG